MPEIQNTHALNTKFSISVIAMAIVVAASNYLVQFPVQAQLGGFDFSEILTWGAFTYPFAFMVNDMTNRHFGPKAARRVVYVGFAIAIMVSFFLSSPRIAIASGTAFLMSQLLDTVVFHNLRRNIWWAPPLIAAALGSFIDTFIFFSIAFAQSFAFLDTGLGLEDASLAFPVQLLSFSVQVPLWTSLALGDLMVKLIMSLLMLIPYRLLRDVIPDRVTAKL